MIKIKDVTIGDKIIDHQGDLGIVLKISKSYIYVDYPNHIFNIGVVPFSIDNQPTFKRWVFYKNGVDKLDDIL